MRFKGGVKIFGVRPEMIWAALVVYQVYVELENEANCVITSCIDGEHKRGSDHYAGLAIDVRVWGFKELGISLDKVAEMIDECLTDEFEVFNEQDHIHIGFDPQQGLA